MRVSLAARDLVVVTWAVPPAAARRDLPQDVELALTDDGLALVSLVGFAASEVSVGVRRVPGWSQLAVRTYVSHAGEDGIFFLVQRVTPVGLAGSLLGLPLRPARIRASAGKLDAPGLGVSVRYETRREAADVPRAGGIPIGAQQVAFYVSAGLRRLPSSHEPTPWMAAELTEPPRADPVLALGFDPADPVSVLAAESARFRFELPARRVS
jgi:uncharacterized protein YqjF (DUF2071 family)